MGALPKDWREVHARRRADALNLEEDDDEGDDE